MAKKKILFISQEIMPYLPESEMAHIGRYLPQGIQEKGSWQHSKIHLPFFIKFQYIPVF